MPNRRMLKVSRSLLRKSRSKWRLNSNRILRSNNPRQFVRVSFGSLRFLDTSIRVTGEYISRFFKKGLFLNDRFYHHSNSQLRERSCFLRQANNDQELDNRIYQLGDFARIMIVGKRAKRIGLLFSAAELNYTLDPQYISDIPDIKSGDEVFSDGYRAYQSPARDTIEQEYTHHL
ncbi:RNA dependent RNA polymerase domain containing protein [Amanita muscaria]